MHKKSVGLEHRLESRTLDLWLGHRLHYKEVVR